MGVMLKKLLIFMSVCLGQFAFAGYPAKVLYWYNLNVSTNVVELVDIVELVDRVDGAGTRLNWHISSPPSKATIDAIDNTVATAWLVDRDDTEESDYEEWSPKLRKLARLFVAEINKLRVKNGDTPYTPAQVKNALKGE